MALNSDGVILLAPGMLCMLTQCSLSCRKSRASGHRRSHSPHRQLTASDCQFQHSLGRTCGCLPRRTMPLSASFSRPRLFTCSSQAEDAPAGRRARTPAAAALEFEVWPEITWAGTSSLAPVQRADDVAPPCPDCRDSVFTFGAGCKARVPRCLVWPSGVRLQSLYCTTFANRP